MSKKIKFNPCAISTAMVIRGMDLTKTSEVCCVGLRTLEKYLKTNLVPLEFMFNLMHGFNLPKSFFVYNGQNTEVLDEETLKNICT